MNRRILLAAILIACATFTGSAQPDTAKKYQKIEELFKLMNMEQRCLQSANTSADQTIRNSPKLAGKEKEVRAFFVKYMGFPAVKTDFANLYAKYYSPEEIDDLIAVWKTSDLTKFNNTSTGKKEPVTSKKIETELTEIRSRNVQPHAEELTRLVSP